MNNIVITDYYKNNNWFGGVCSRDNLIKLENRFYIVNTDSRYGKGFHWVLLFNCSPNKIIYFDSFGVAPLQEIEDLMKKSSKPYKIYNSYRIQGLNSKLCGVYCIYVADELLKGNRKFYEVLTDFSNSNFELNNFKYI